MNSRGLIAALLVALGLAIPSNAAATLPVTWCGSPSADAASDAVFEHSNAPKFKVIYAYATDQGNRVMTYADRLQSIVSDVDGLFVQATGGASTVRFDLGTSCGPDFLDIGVVPLTNASSVYPGDRAVWDELRTTLPGRFPGHKNFLVFFEVAGERLPTGLSSSDTNADIPGWASVHNQHGRVSVVSMPATEIADSPTRTFHVAAHEILHALGAVQSTAPHFTAGGHCNDSVDDLLCIPREGDATTIDGGGDDYFNPAPAPGSYLDTHFNIARDSLFLCGVQQCDAQLPAPPVTLHASNLRPTPGEMVTITASGADRYHWTVGGVLQLGAGATAGGQITIPAPASTTEISARGFAASGPWSDASVTLSPATTQPPPAPAPPVAHIDWTRTAARTVRLDASRSSGNGTAITAYRWDVDADGRADLSGPTVIHKFRDGSAHPVTLVVTNAAGLTATATAGIPAQSGETASLSATPTRQKRATLLTRGLQVSGAARGRVLITVAVDARTRQTLRLRAGRIAAKRFTANGRFTLRVRLTPHVRRAITTRRITTLTVTATGAVKARRIIVIQR